MPAMESAMQWVLRLRDEALTEEDLAEWTHWYDSDERNKKAFDECQAFWHFTAGLGSGPEGEARMRRLRSESVASRRYGLPLAVAASVSIIVLGVLLTWRLPVRGIPEGSKPKTEPALSETLLPDGSKVQLAAKSSLVLRYTPTERLLELRGGEAYFSVAPDRLKPFIVSVGRLRVCAVGTAFNVRWAGERTVVTVDKGTVDIYSTNSDRASSDKPAASQIRVTAGSEVTWVENAPRPVITSVDPERALSWREGRLEYIDEPLSAVIADVNRYARHPITIRDGKAAAMAFTGTVFTNSTDEWLEALPGEFPVDLISDGATRVLVSRLPRDEAAREVR